MGSVLTLDARSLYCLYKISEPNSAVADTDAIFIFARTAAVVRMIFCDCREGDVVAFVVNATPVVCYNYRLGVRESGFYSELINTDAETYGGSNVGNFGGVQTQDVPWMGRQQSATGNCGV